MKILISGASGLLGTNLIPALRAQGHDVFKLVRKAPQADDEIQWDARTGFSDAEKARLDNFDAVIHLAGDNIASENWSDEKKKKIRESRVLGTKVLVDALKDAQNPPRTFISASATGFYGDGKEAILTEDIPKGEGFLPDLCDEWEQEARKAESFARVVLMRTGIVLAKDGGALEKMLTPFKFGVGGTIGSGKQWMSWIALDDEISAIQFFLDNENLSGAFNLTAPNPVRNEEFTETLGKVLHRPTLLPVPAFGIKLLFGEMGERLLLEGARVLPKNLEAAGYKFIHPHLEDAMREAVKD